MTTTVMTTDTLLRVEELQTHFFTRRGVVRAVDGVNLTLRKGETLGLVGESGCGKSVTAMSIMRLIPQPPGRIVHGRILFEDVDLVRLSASQMRRIRGNKISMIFQEPMTSLDPVFTVGQELIETLLLHQNLTRQQARDGAVQMLRLVGIPEPERRMQEYPHQLSGGMQQRVMIAMALSCNPALLIADEPTTALDVTIQAQILELMNDLKKKLETSVLLITHDLGVVAETCQWVAVMYAGQIVESAPVEELFQEPLHPYTVALNRSIPRLDLDSRRLDIIPGTVPNLIDLPKGCRFYSRCSRRMDICQQEAPPVIHPSVGHQVRCWLFADQAGRTEDGSHE